MHLKHFESDDDEVTTSCLQIMCYIACCGISRCNWWAKAKARV